METFVGAGSTGADMYVPEQRGEDVLGIATRDLTEGEWVTLGPWPECDIDTSNDALETYVNGRPVR